jgi:hypothetical protein
MYSCIVVSLVAVKASKKEYRISANSFRGNYSFLEVGVGQVCKGGNYSREEMLFFFFTFCKFL